MNFSAPTIRPASLADLPVILGFERESPTASHWSATEYEKRIENGVLLVAEREGDICGFLCAREAAGEWELENVVVGGQFRRQGFGSQLLRALIRHAKQAAASAILLEVRESNLPARRLYEQNGFGQEGRRRAYYQHPAEDALIYRLGLRDL